MQRLLCPHPDCPQMFKSRNGRTYHMRAVHRNTNIRPVNDVRHRSQSPQPPDLDDELGAVPAPNDRRERIKHPHLTGMYYRYIARRVAGSLTCS